MQFENTDQCAAAGVNAVGASCARRSGFTLVEVIVAGAILLLFCAGFFSVYLVSMRTQRTAVNHYRALCLARNRVQRARIMPYDSLELMTESDVAVDDFGAPSVGGRYTRTTIVQVFTNTTAPLTRLSVRVHYPLPGGRLSSTPVEVDTLISDPM